jgi:DNA (cytosine-5)-methyltransferase 1
MITLINNSFKERRGKPAIWIEGHKLVPAFKPHERFNLIISEEKREVRFEKDLDGEKKVSIRSARGNSVDLPLIEVRDERLLDVFELGMELRVVVTEGLVVFTVHGDDLAAVERTQRFLNRVKEGKPLRVGSIFTGGGVLDKAIHEGMKIAGVDSYLKVCVESDERYVESLMQNQSDLFRSDSIVINSLIEKVEFRKNFCLEIMVLGIPCTGSSQAGKSKLKIKGAEQHESAGACFFYALNMIKAAQPAIIVLENVTNYKSEMSYFVILVPL